MKPALQRIRKIRKLKKWLRTQQHLRDETIYLPAMPPHQLIGELFNLMRMGRKAIRKQLKRIYQSKTMRIRGKGSELLK